MRAMDVLLAFPGFILAAAIIAVLGIGVQNLISALGLRSLPVFARLARNMTLSLRERVEEMASGRRTVIRLVGEATGASQVDVHINVLRPGGPDGRYHYHDHTENVYWVLSGRGRLTVEGEVHEIGPDDVVFLPPKVRHSLSNHGTEELRLLEIYAPAGRNTVQVD